MNRWHDKPNMSIDEIVYRIYHHIEEAPKCCICGKWLQYNNWAKGYSNSKGYVSVFCSDKCRKTQEGIKIWQKKVGDTCEEKFGARNVYASEYGKKKVKESTFRHFGTEFCQQVPEVREKAKKTNLERYGIENGGGSKQSQEKIYKTKKINHTFSSSKVEVEFKSWLEEKFEKDDIIYQYKDDKRYPFSCDFYIISLDLFIEIQGFASHGTHPFNPSSKEDQERLETLKAKSEMHPMYKTFIEIWTVRDPLKRKIARDNRLNFIEIFSSKTQDCINIVESYLLS